jgi:hypothetical protein
VTSGHSGRAYCTEEQETTEAEEPRRDEDEEVAGLGKSLSNELKGSLVFFALGVVSTIIGVLFVNFNQPLEYGNPTVYDMQSTAGLLVILGISLMAICALIAVSASRKIRRMRTSKYKHPVSRF